MKILIYFSGKLFAPKGTPIRVLNIITQLRENGCEIFYAGYDAPPEITPDHVLSLAPPFRRASQLGNFIREKRIEIVYFQAAGLEYGPWLRLTTRARIGMDFHSRRWQEERVYQGYSRITTALYERSELFFARWLHFATGVSYTLAEYYGRVVPRFLVLPVGVDTSVFTPDIQPHAVVADWKKDAILIGYAGNTKWYQGLETVLAAFARQAAAYPGMFKMLVVSSSASAELRAHAKKHALEDAMMIIDRVPHPEIPAILASADILTVVRPLDLVTQYSFPSKLPEYAALGKALIASRVSDIGSYLINRENGMLVTPGSSAEVAAALSELGDLALRVKLGAGARALAVEAFDLKKLGKMLASFLATFC